MSKQEPPRNPNEREQIANQKRNHWLNRFTALYAEAFSRRWQADAVREVWWPTLDGFTLPEIEAGLNELANERKERFPPQPAEWLEILRRQRVKLREQRETAPAETYPPISDENAERLLRLNRELGLPEYAPPEWARP